MSEIRREYRERDGENMNIDEQQSGKKKEQTLHKRRTNKGEKKRSC